jgi:hypothetical protein
MRRILYYSLLCFLWVSVNSCKEDEAAQPPTPTFTVDRTTGLYQSTEFVFTIDQVSSQAVSLLPYGLEQPNTAGILVPASSFVDGKATVKFVYGQVGTFHAVVVANNHSGDGVSVKNSVSAPTDITITSDRTAILEFSLKGKAPYPGVADKTVDVNSTGTDIDTVAHTINVVVPYGTNLATVEPVYKTSDFAEVTTSGTDYSTDVVYTVVSQNGLKTTEWTVHVDVTPIETDNNFKSFQGIVSNKGGRAGRVLPSSIDTVNHVIVLYDTLHTGTAEFDLDNYDSVALDFAVRGKFAYVHFDGENDHLAGKDTVDLADDIKVVIVPQDSTGTVDVDGDDGSITYDVVVVEAPKLHVSFDNLNPSPSGTSDANFNVAINVLNGTDVEAINAYYDFDYPPGMSAVDILDIKANGVSVASSDAVNFKKPASIQVLFENPDGIQFWVTYTVAVTVLK